MKTFTAADIFPLLIKILKMTRPDERNEEALKNNPPRFYRYQQFQAFAKAFNIKGGLDSLFSDNRQLDMYKQWITPDYFDILEKHPFIIEERNRLIKKNVIEEKQPISDGWDLVWMYYFRLAFSLENLKEQTRDLQMGLFSGELCIDIIENLFSDENQKHINKVYRTLRFTNRPNRKKVTLTELVEKYDYPDVDLMDIDIEYY